MVKNVKSQSKQVSVKKQKYDHEAVNMHALCYDIVWLLFELFDFL